MNFRDIIKKEDFTACVARIVFDIYFEPDAPAVAAIQMKRNPAPLLPAAFLISA